MKKVVKEKLNGASPLHITTLGIKKIGNDKTSLSFNP
jgi:hypothetical protein